MFARFITNVNRRANSLLLWMVILIISHACPSPAAAEDGSFSRLALILQSAADAREIAGCSLLVVHNGETQFREAFGYADIESQRLFTVDEICWIASTTKPMTATMLMKLVENGTLSLDDPVDKYLPEFKGARVKGRHEAVTQPTLRQLLSHTSGIYGNSSATPEQMEVIRNPDRSLAESVSLIARYDFLSEPGTKFDYSGAGYCVAGRIAEIVTGMSLEDVMQDTLFKPLGMTHTTFKPPLATYPLMPITYSREPEGLIAKPRMVPEREPEFILAGGGLVSTLDDMAAFLQMVLNGGVYGNRRILTEESIAEMHRRQSPPDSSPAYGLGWAIRRVTEDDRTLAVIHSGATGPFVYADMAANLGVVFLTQQPLQQVASLKEKILGAVTEAVKTAATIEPSRDQAHDEPGRPQSAEIEHPATTEQDRQLQEESESGVTE